MTVNSVKRISLVVEHTLGTIDGSVLNWRSLIREYGHTTVADFSGMLEYILHL